MPEPRLVNEGSKPLGKWLKLKGFSTLQNNLKVLMCNLLSNDFGRL